MRKLMFFLRLLVLAAVAWGGYWFVGATMAKRVLADWFEARRAEGWVAEAAISVRGFPNRFDTTFSGLSLADPGTGVAWSAPLFQTLALSYRPTRMIAVWPGRQTFSTPDATITLEAQTMRGSMTVAPGRSLPLVTTTIEFTEAAFASTTGREMTLAAGQYSMRQSPGALEPDTYDLYFTARGVNPGEAFLAPLRGAARLPDVFDGVEIEATVRFDRPWDIRAIEEARPQPLHVRLDGFEASWGALRLSAAGRLDVVAAGHPVGEIRLQATNWREMVAVAEAAGALAPETARAVTRGLELLAALSGDPETLEVPLEFRNGRSYIGPVPVGAAPDLRLP